MTANTPNGLPYPVGTDRVMDGDNAIEALARGVDTGVLAQTVTNLIVTGVASGGVSYFYRGGLVIVSAQIQSFTTNIAAGGTLDVVIPANGIPARYRPPTDWYGACFTGGTIGWFRVQQSDGRVAVRAPTGAGLAAAYGHLTYPVAVNVS